MESWRRFNSKDTELLSERKYNVRNMARIQRNLFRKLDTTMVDLPALKSLGDRIPLKKKLEKLQTFLFQKGYFEGVAQKLGRKKLKTITTGKDGKRYQVDGIYGSETIEAIKNLQKAMGFDPPEDYDAYSTGKIDGLFGNDTIGELGMQLQLGAAGAETINNVGDAPNTDDAERDTVRQRDNLKVYRKRLEDATRKVQKVALEKFDIQLNNAEPTAEDDKKRRDLFNIQNALKFLGPDNEVVKNYNEVSKEYTKFSNLASEDPMMKARSPKSLDSPKNNPKKGEYSGRTFDKSLSNAGIPRDRGKKGDSPKRKRRQ